MCDVVSGLYNSSVMISVNFDAVGDGDGDGNGNSNGGCGIVGLDLVPCFCSMFEIALYYAIGMKELYAFN